MTVEHPTFGLILAGGQGRRCGGRDKAWLRLAGRPLFCHVHQRLHPQVDRVLVSANRHRWAYRRLGVRSVADVPRWSGCGPLAAIASALTLFPMVRLAVAPVDCPMMPRDHVRLLSAALASGAVAAALCNGARRQPLFALLSPMVLPAAIAALESARIPAMRDWLDGLGAEWIDYDDADGVTFANVNRIEDLRELERLCAHD